MLDTALLIRRQDVPVWLSVATYAGGLTFGLCAAALCLVQLGVPADALWQEFVVQTFLTQQGLGQTLTAAIPLVLVSLGAALSMRVRFWNIGIEGQLWLGAMAATWISLHDFGPGPLRLWLMMAAALVAGALWMALPLALKLLWNVSAGRATTPLDAWPLAFLMALFLEMLHRMVKEAVIEVMCKDVLMDTIIERT